MTNRFFPETEWTSVDEFYTDTTRLQTRHPDPSELGQALKAEIHRSTGLTCTVALASGKTVAKIAAIELCDSYRREHGADFISAMPTNLYGPHDNYDLKGSHVMAALIRKTHEATESGAKSVEVWGTGTPKREREPPHCTHCW